MKKYICILAGAALLAACEQKTETTQPAATPASTSPPAVANTPLPAAAGAAESPATTTESPATTTESPAGAAESPAQTPPGS